MRSMVCGLRSQKRGGLAEAVCTVARGSQVAQWKKNLLPVQEAWETQVQCLGQEDPLEEEMATHSNILAFRIPWTEEPDGLQFIGSQRVRHD